MAETAWPESLGLFRIGTWKWNLALPYAFLDGKEQHSRVCDPPDHGLPPGETSRHAQREDSV